MDNIRKNNINENKEENENSTEIRRKKYKYNRRQYLNNLPKHKNGKVKMQGQSKAKDTIQRIFYSNEENFAEVFNKSVFRGNEISPNELCDADSSENGVITYGSDELVTHFDRDIIKKLCRGTQLLLLAVENSTYVDYAIPIKVLNYCCVNYNNQIMKIRDSRRNRHCERLSDRGDKENNASSDEYLSRFMKTDRLTGIVTLLIYYGEKEWDGPLSLCDMMNLSEGGRALVSDFKLQHFIDVMRLSDEQIDAFEGQVKALFGFLRYRNDIGKLMEFINRNEELFQDMQDTTRLAISIIGDMQDWYEELTEMSDMRDESDRECEKEGGLNMRQFFHEVGEYYLNEGKVLGLDEGKQVGLRTTAINMLKAGMPVEKIALFTELPISEIEELMLTTQV